MITLGLDLRRADGRVVDLEQDARRSARPREDRGIMLRELTSSTLMDDRLEGRLADTVTEMANRQDGHAQHTAQHERERGGSHGLAIPGERRWRPASLARSNRSKQRSYKDRSERIRSTISSKGS